MRLIGPNGYTIERTDFPGGPQFESIYVGDRYHFRAQADAKTDELFIGKPAIGQVTGRLTIQISRRLRHPDGSFAGTLVASLDPAFVEKFFETVDLGQQASVILHNTERRDPRLARPDAPVGRPAPFCSRLWSRRLPVARPATTGAAAQSMASTDWYRTGRPTNIRCWSCSASAKAPYSKPIGTAASPM